MWRRGDDLAIAYVSLGSVRCFFGSGCPLAAEAFAIDSSVAARLLPLVVLATGVLSSEAGDELAGCAWMSAEAAKESAAVESAGDEVGAAVDSTGTVAESEEEAEGDEGDAAEEGAAEAADEESAEGAIVVAAMGEEDCASPEFAGITCAAPSLVE